MLDGGKKKHAPRDEAAPKATQAKPLPTSLYPPVKLIRPLGVFGSTFQVEVSTGLTFNPDTVLRASVGRSLQNVLRSNGMLLPVRQMAYSLQGKHKPTATTISSIHRSIGPMGNEITQALSGNVAPEGVSAAQRSDWEIVASTMGKTSGDKDLIRRAVTQFGRLDSFARQLADRVRGDDRAGAESELSTRFGDFALHWRGRKYEVGTRGLLLIETSLRVIAALEVPFVGGPPAGGPWPSAALQLLAPQRKPIGHWLSDLACEARCKNLIELSDALARKGAALHDRPILHDTLKAWSSMRAGMLMPLKACDALLIVVDDAMKASNLRARFVLARFLCFLCDFLISSAESHPLKWQESQIGLRARYEAVLMEALAADCGTGAARGR